MATREAFYECIFTSDRDEYRFHFRAWSAEAASVALHQELRAGGVTARGIIVVRDARGRLVRRVEYGAPGELATA